MNKERFDKFAAQYRSELAMIAQEDPGYFMAGRSINTIADNMLKGIEEHGIRAVNISNSKGFQRTCSALGIKQTYKAIEEYLNNADT